MAGTYPDAPSRRMAWDADGSIGLQRTGPNNGTYNPVVEANAALKAELNDEDDPAAWILSSFGGTDGYLIVIFPELREVDGVFAAKTRSGNLGAVDTSADTVDGVAGTWTNRIADITDYTTVYTNGRYRSNITSMAVSNARAIRLYIAANNGGCDVSAFHIYGEISPGQTPDRILILDDNTGLEFTKPLDYGDVPRGGSEDYPIRLRNDSATLTATTVQYTVEDLYLDAALWFTHTLPGGATYQATQQITSIGPATTTAVITTRRITPGTNQLGIHAARLYANVGTWS